MSRQKGSRNKNYDEERGRLAALAFTALVEAGDKHLSFRQFAEACEVSPSTMRHYFGDRQGVVAAAVEHARHGGEPHLALVRSAELGPPEESLMALLRYLTFGWMHSPLGDVHRVGLEAGLGDEHLGPVYVRELLEPTLQAFAVRLQMHIDRGELAPCNTRFAAVSFLSPVILAMLHQKQLHGCNEYPLSLDEFIQSHTQAFLRGYRSEAPQPEETPIAA